MERFRTGDYQGVSKLITGQKGTDLSDNKFLKYRLWVHWAGFVIWLAS